MALILMATITLVVVVLITKTPATKPLKPTLSPELTLDGLVDQYKCLMKGLKAGEYKHIFIKVRVGWKDKNGAFTHNWIDKVTWALKTLEVRGSKEEKSIKKEDTSENIEKKIGETYLIGEKMEIETPKDVGIPENVTIMVALQNILEEDEITFLQKLTLVDGEDRLYYGKRVVGAVKDEDVE